MTRLRLAPPLLAILVLIAATTAHAGGKLVLSGVRMDPSDVDARQYARPGWGGGIELVVPLPSTATLLAGVVGIDVVNLLSQTKKFTDPITSLRVEQQTSQEYARVYAGGQVGPHGRGALRPYAGANLALVLYGINTDVVVPNDANRENEIRQSLHERNEAAFGWDASAGLDINFSDHWCVDLGVRTVHQYGIPQQLGDGAVTIEPAYLQYHVGIGVGLGVLRGH